jgi:hypothetical protein
MGEHVVHLAGDPPALGERGRARDCLAHVGQLRHQQLVTGEFLAHPAPVVHGRVIEVGPHRSLLKADGLYAQLYNLQASSLLSAG